MSNKNNQEAAEIRATAIRVLFDAKDQADECAAKALKAAEAGEDYNALAAAQDAAAAATKAWFALAKLQAAGADLMTVNKATDAAQDADYSAERAEKAAEEAAWATTRKQVEDR